MRAALLHNPSAGDGGPDARELVDAFEDIGWATVYCHDVERALEPGFDVVVVIGGDGTVGKVAKRVAMSNVCLAIIPTGTANNIAHSLDLDVGDPIKAIGRLASPREVKLDLGEALEERFVEGFGVGAFAELLRADEMHDAEHIIEARNVLAQELERYTPRAVTIEIDGRVVRGSYLFVSVMNTRSLGPALGFAPEARMDDGMLDVALVGEEMRRTIIRKLESEERVISLATECYRAQHVRIRARHSWSHVDDTAHPLPELVEIGIARHAVRVLLPSG